MLTKVHGSDSFQVLTSSFSISPSEQGYVLNISANGKDFSPLFTVGAGVTRLVTGMASGSYYKLVGNESDVVVNWVRTCVTEGGSGGSGATYTAGDYIDITQDVISVTGITPDLYLTSADTQNFATSADVQSAYTILDDHITEVEEIAASGFTELHAGLLEVSGRTSLTSGDVQTQIDASISGKADSKTLVDFDKTSQAERAGLYSTLKGLYDGGSGATINKTYDFYKTVGTKQGLKIDYYTFSADTLVFGKVVSPDNISDQVVYGQVMTIDSAGTVNVVTNTVGGSSGEPIDMSAYMTSGDAQVISTALNDLNTRVSGLSAASADYLTSADTQDFLTSADTQNFLTSADTANFMDDTDAQVISTALNDLNTNKVAGSGISTILRIEQTAYDTLVSQSATTSTTLYVVMPDSQ